MVLGKIYIVRSQKGIFTNCNDSKNITDAKRLAQIFMNLNVKRVYTKLPEQKNSHFPSIRNVQTAANICSYMNLNLDIIQTPNDLPSFDIEDILIVWDHNKINELLNRFGITGYFIWPIDNYNGCVMLNSSGWVFETDFLEKHPANCGLCNIC